MDRQENSTSPTEENTLDPLPYASLVLRGKNLNPQKITDTLGLSATRSFQRGDIRKNGKAWPHGFWELDSKGQVQSSKLTSHIEWILEKIEPLQEKLSAIIQEQSLDAHISCFWIISNDNQYLLLEPGLIKRLAQCNIAIGIDLYD